MDVMSALLLARNATTGAQQHAAEQVLGPQHLAHLLPHGQQVARDGFPHRFVDSVGWRPAVFAGDRAREVGLRDVGRLGALLRIAAAAAGPRAEVAG